MTGLQRIESWFASRGWEPWDFQRRTWDAFSRGESGLVQVPTGAGKTYAAALGPLAALIDEVEAGLIPRSARLARASSTLRVLYITPLRAVTRDIELALRAPAEELGLPIIVESRTGDTAAHVRARQRLKLPHVLVTTPESLALMLTRENAKEQLAHVSAVIVDEWHDLLVSKRGTLLELSLARLRSVAPRARTWGLSATLPNPEEALRALLGTDQQGEPMPGRVVRADLTREVVIETILPHEESRLPWAGHLGLTMLDDALRALDVETPTIVFVNTRSQAERWFHAIEFARPEWAPRMALHHGSLDRDERERVEGGLKSGALRLVVATSSLDLGVDFGPVERVVQIGSPKGLARVVQRAGRASHRPGASCRILCLPTHAMELIEIAGSRRALLEGKMEPRFAQSKPLDVLAQHLVTCGMGGGFLPEELLREVRRAWSYRSLTREEFDWALHLVHMGGVLHAYPQFRKLVRGDDGVLRGAGGKLAQVHRMNVGTITGDAALEIRLQRGRRLGVIDEHFVTHLRRGQRFVFAGKVLRFEELRDGVVLVSPAKGSVSNTPIWGGTRLPISESLSEAIRAALQRAGSEDVMRGESDERELLAARRLVETQRRLSMIPKADETLAEVTRTREGTHLFVFPFEGRLVHAGLASLLALRLARLHPATFSVAVNDYGFEVLCDSEYAFEAALRDGEVWSERGLAEDVTQSVDAGQLSRLAFREIARVAGLVTQTMPGAKRTGKQLQASSGLLFDVLSDFDPGNLLLEQARREVLEKHFEEGRLGRTLARLRKGPVRVVSTQRLTPLSFPLVIERVASTMSGESIEDRLSAMRAEWERGESSGPPETKPRAARVRSRRKT